MFQFKPNKGSRLTAFELVAEGIPSTLITDSMVSAAIQKHEIDAIVVGADRVAKNGDTANKIGTLQLGNLFIFTEQANLTNLDEPPQRFLNP